MSFGLEFSRRDLPYKGGSFLFLLFIFFFLTKEKHPAKWSGHVHFLFFIIFFFLVNTDFSHYILKL